MKISSFFSLESVQMDNQLPRLAMKYDGATCKEYAHLIFKTFFIYL